MKDLWYKISQRWFRETYIAVIWPLNDVKQYNNKKSRRRHRCITRRACSSIMIERPTYQAVVLTRLLAWGCSPTFSNCTLRWRLCWRWWNSWTPSSASSTCDVFLRRCVDGCGEMGRSSWTPSIFDLCRLFASPSRLGWMRERSLQTSKLTISFSFLDNLRTETASGKTVRKARYVSVNYYLEIINWDICGGAIRHWMWHKLKGCSKR
jgi:hypothetical protein